MILPETYELVLALMILSLICLGSWAGMFKLAGKWRFELFYLDFALGLFLAALIYSFTVGNLGFDGFNFLDDLMHAGKHQWLYAFLAGIIFNLANMLLMACVAVAGMALAFPMTIGIAVLIATAIGAISSQPGNTLLVALGCLLLVVSVALSAAAYRMAAVVRHEALARAGKAKTTRRPSSVKAILLALFGGLLMGSFGPLLEKASGGDIGMGPYSLTAVFALGILITTPVLSVFFMNLPAEGDPIDINMIFSTTWKQHVLGLLGGAIWCTGALAAAITVSVPPQIQPGPLLRSVLAQAWPLVAAIWGILIFREFKGTDTPVRILGVLTIVLYLCGLGMIALAPIYVAGKG
jgi:glucose uptake protein